MYVTCIRRGAKTEIVSMMLAAAHNMLSALCYRRPSVCLSVTRVMDPSKTIKAIGLSNFHRTVAHTSIFFWGGEFHPQILTVSTWHVHAEEQMQRS